MAKENEEILSLIRSGLTINQLKSLIKDKKTPLPVFIAAIQGFNRYCTIIKRLEEFNEQ